MKLENLNNVAEVVGDIKSNAVKVSAAKMDKIVGLLSSNLYSRPFDSFIREITSNAWDSHVESGNTDSPVIISLKRSQIEDGKFEVNIRDYGVGLSPQRFNEIYRLMGESTKDDSDDYLGAYGLGKFSATAVSDIVNVISFYEGKRYDYLMYKNGVGINIDDVNVQDTDEPNGVLVQVTLPNDNYTKIISSIRKELMFFENVYLENQYAKWDNEFNNIRYKHFNHFSINTELRALALLQKTVVYPLDLNAIASLVSKEDYKVIESLRTSCIALRVDIGAVEIAPAREDLLYTEKTLKAIIEKAKLVVEELHDLKRESLKGGILELSDLKTLENSNILHIEEFGKFYIPTFHEEILIDELLISYSTLYDKTQKLLEKSNNLATQYIDYNSIKGYEKVQIEFNKWLKGKKRNYNPTDYKPIEKRYIREFNSNVYLRPNWLGYFKSYQFRLKFLSYSRKNPVKKLFYKLLLSEASSITKFDLSGMTDSWIEDNKPQRSPSTEIIYHRWITNYGDYKYKYRGDVDTIMSLNDTIVVVDKFTDTWVLGIVDFFKGKGVQIVATAFRNHKKLIEAGAINFNTLIERYKDTIVEHKKASYFRNQFNSDEISNILRIKNIVPIKKDWFKYLKIVDESSHLASFLKEPPVIEEYKVREEMIEILDLAEAFNLDSDLGIEFFIEKVNEKGLTNFN